jgi:ABC-type uncharacterized transport system ATPase subunit
VLTALGIRKTYGATVACAGVALTVAPGSVHGLVGENGAGKSTLLRIIAGLVAPDAGTITVDGRPVTSLAVARAAGIALVHQHFSQVAAYTAVDNALLAAPGGWWLDRPAMAGLLTATAERLGFHLPLDRPVGALAVGDRQRLEIVKALVAAGGRPRVLLLDEPTAVLAPSEVDALIAVVRRLATDGTAVVFTGHKLAEIAACCDAVTVLRRGAVVHAGPVPDGRTLTRLMIGATGALEPATTRIAHDEPALEHLDAPPAADVPARASVLCFTDLSLPGGRWTGSVQAGEVVAVVGVDGNGQDALVRAVLAADAPPGVTRPAGGVAAIGVIPEDRHHDGLVLDRAIAWNLGLRHQRTPSRSWHGWLRPRAWRALAAQAIARHDIRASGPDQPAGDLSGGNQQKVVVARALAGDPTLVVAVNPTRGLDVAASQAVLDDLDAARQRGAAVLLVHYDLDEALAVADRVWVMHGGAVVDSGWPACDRAAIGAMMLGAHHA